MIFPRNHFDYGIPGICRLLDKSTSVDDHEKYFSTIKISVKVQFDHSMQFNQDQKTMQLKITNPWSSSWHHRRGGTILNFKLCTADFVQEFMLSEIHSLFRLFNRFLKISTSELAQPE